MTGPAVQPTTSGPAFRVTVVAPQHAVAYEQVYAQLDAAHGVVHVLSADGRTHYLSVPIGCAVIEWQDAAALQPQPGIPAYAPGAFGRMGEQMQRMMDEMGGAFGQG